MLSINVIPDLTELSNGLLGLTVSLIEDDDNLVNKFVQASIAWGDGSTTSIPKQAITVGDETTPVIYTHSYLPGKYLVTVNAQNFRSPTPDTDIYTLVIEVIQQVEVVTRPSVVLVVGPILPRDNGFPNADQWNFNIGENLATVESSIRTLLAVGKGERLMDPEFGTNLRQIIFELNDGDRTLEKRISEEILLAVERFLPSVTLQSTSVVSPDADKRRVNVDLRFVAKPRQQTFQVKLNFER